jgi:hypothetical protein
MPISETYLASLPGPQPPSSISTLIALRWSRPTKPLNPASTNTGLVFIHIVILSHAPSFQFSSSLTPANTRATSFRLSLFRPFPPLSANALQSLWIRKFCRRHQSFVCFDISSANISLSSRHPVILPSLRCVCLAVMHTQTQHPTTLAEVFLFSFLLLYSCTAAWGYPQSYLG